MLIDRTHKPWIFGTVLASAIAGSAHWAVSKQSPHGVTGGSVLGLWLGIAGSVLMVFAALLAVRKRLPTWRVGSAQLWLRGHLWLGTLGFVLVLFHAGFRWGGLLENLLWISFGLVVATGIAGVILQQVIPRLLTSNVPLETMVAQIPFLSRTMQFRADQLVAKQAGVLDIDFEPIKPFAEEVLKQQRVLKRESDFPKELAKVYANVPQPEGDGKKPHAPTPASIVTTKPAVAALGPAAESAQGTSAGAEPPAAPTVPAVTTADSPPAKPKSPLELMREKAAAKAAGSEPAAASTEPAKKLSPIEQMRAKKAAAEAAAAPVVDAASAPTAEPATPAAEPVKKLSPIEQMRAKKAAAEAAAASAVEAPVAESASVPLVEPETPAAEPVKKLSPIEQMRAKKAAAEAATAAPVVEAPVADVAAAPSADVAPPAVEPAKKLSPIEQMRAKKAAAEALAGSAPAPTTDAAPPAVPEKKLSPMEQMKAKLAAAKPATDAAEHKPLTIDKSAEAVADKPASPIKKPTPIAKPSTEKPAVATPIKQASPVPPALLAELRDFHVRVVRSFLVNGRSPQYRLDDDIASRRVFAQLRSDLPAELHDVLHQLEDLCEERRQFNTQLRLHRWLHWWLILHIPPSMALLVLFVAHVLVSLRVVPF